MYRRGTVLIVRYALPLNVGNRYTHVAELTIDEDWYGTVLTVRYTLSQG
jgi:hypothetical protein